ncbi:MAG TPA: DUF3239 domain-containing protein [Abditibacteriaceae bacterium]|jgi:hypothetical protein
MNEQNNGDEKDWDNWDTLLASDTVASNPGHVKIEWIRFFRAFPTAFLWFSGTLIILTLLTIYKGLGWSVALVIAVLLSLHGLRRLRVHFAMGDVNPGVIFSQQPPRIAVMTNLSQGFDDYPVVRILPHPLRAAGLGNEAIGTRVATISLYHMQRGKEPHWSGFNPVVVQAATTKKEVQERVYASIAESEWSNLENALNNLPTKEVGIYAIGWQAEPGSLVS